MGRTLLGVAALSCVVLACSSDSAPMPCVHCSDAATPPPKHREDGGDRDHDASSATGDPVHIGGLKPNGRIDAGNDRGSVGAGPDGGEQAPPDPDSGTSDAGKTPEAPACSEPAVTFVIDGSGSMCTPFDLTTRWQSVRDGLLGAGRGAIYEWQDRVKIGLAVYDGTSDSTLKETQGSFDTPIPECATAVRSSGSCPDLVMVDPALDNAAAINVAYPALEPGGSRPTDKAIETVVDQVIAANDDTDRRTHPVAIVLVTDGLPSLSCVGDETGDGVAQKNAVVAAVQRAADAGIYTLVLEMSNNNVRVDQYLSNVTLTGWLGPNAILFRPNTHQELRTNLDQIMQKLIVCAM